MVRKVSTSTMRDGSFPFGNGTGKPTLVRGHLPLKFRWITHTKRLRPPVCRQCHASDHMALDTRGSERVAGFQWICRRCNRTSNVFAGYCTECQWPGGGTLGRMSIQVHRAGSTFYPHTTVLLNIPRGQLDAFLSLPEWPAVAAAKFLSMPGFHNRALSSFTPVSHQQDDQDVGLSNT